MELRKPLALLILWTYDRLCLCAIAIYIAFKLLPTWNHREKTSRNNNFSLKWQTNSQLTFFIAITLTLIEKKLFLEKSSIILLIGSRKIAPKENCPPALIITLILNQTLTLTGRQFSSGQFSGHHFKRLKYLNTFK